MKKIIIPSLLSIITCHSLAHDVWIKTDRHEIHTDEQHIFSFDVSRSGTTLVAESNHGFNQLSVTSPQGQSSLIKVKYSGETKEVFDVAFDQGGTYFIQVLSQRCF